MKTLQRICLEHVPTCVWYSLSPFMQGLLVPFDMRLAFARLQRRILERRKRRMDSISSLLTTQLKISLVPKQSRQLDVRESGKLVRGDHLVVMVGGETGYGHHGLYLGPYQDDIKVVEFASPTGDKLMRDARIQVTTYLKFTRAYDRVYVVPYAGADDSFEGPDTHECQLALHFAESPRSDHDKYDLIRWNCEAFVLLCNTGQYQRAEQIISMIG